MLFQSGPLLLKWTIKGWTNDVQIAFGVFAIVVDVFSDLDAGYKNYIAPIESLFFIFKLKKIKN